MIVKCDLVVSAAASMKALSCLPDTLNQQCLYIHVNIFCIDGPCNFPIACILKNAIQSIDNCIGIFLRENALCTQHCGMCNGTQNILFIHPVSNFNALIKFKYHLIRILTEPATP